MASSDTGRSLFLASKADSVVSEILRYERVGAGETCCPRCGEVFWQPGAMDIALAANKKWRAGWSRRMRQEEHERCVERLAAHWCPGGVGKHSGLPCKKCVAAARKVLSTA